MPATRILRLDEPGQQLRRIREKLGLKFRDVSEASLRIAKVQSNREFAIGLSRLADIENKRTVPNIYRIYSLAAIYGLDFNEILAMFGVFTANLPRDSIRLGFAQSRQAQFKVAKGVTKLELPALLDKQIDLRGTSYISRQIHRWGALPAALLQSLDLRNQRYAFIGTDDWSMYPMIRPGSFVQIDENRRMLKREVFQHEFERPIYLVEHRSGFRCGWCSVRANLLIVHSHAASGMPSEVYKYPAEVDVVGQVVAVAMRFDLEKQRRARS